MTLTEVAEYLRVTEKTILRQLHKGEFPGFKVGNQWRFIRSSIDDWMISSMEEPSAMIVDEKAGQLIPLIEHIDHRYILLDIKEGTKKELLTQLVSPLIKGNLLSTPEMYINKLLKRENIRSTGTGNEIAFPHLSDPRENSGDFPSLIIGKCPAGTDFDSIDGKKVKIFFLLCSNKQSLHLELLSRLSRICLNSDVINHLIESETEEEFYNILNLNDTNKN